MNDFHTILYEPNLTNEEEIKNLHSALISQFPDKYFMFLPNGFSFAKMDLEDLKRIRESLDIFISHRESLEKH